MIVNLPSVASVSAHTPPGRDRAVDVARLGSLLVVMFGHCALLLGTVTDQGVWIGNTLGAAPSLQPLTWLLQVMPLFFLAGAASAAYGLDRTPQPWGGWLLSRAQRLVRPVLWYLGFWALLLLAVRMLAGAPSAARLGNESVALLWFIGVYLLVLATVPLLLRIRGGWSAAGVIGVLLALTAVGDWARWRTGELDSGFGGFLTVWMIPAVIGVLYARRVIRPAAALLIAAVVFAAAVGLVLIGPYDVPLVVTGTETFSNSTPPTLLLGLHCVWMSLLFVAVAKPIRRWAARPRVWYPVALGNNGAMTLYLWHIPAIAVAAFGLHFAFGGRLDAVDPAQHWFWGLIALRAVVFAVVMFVLFLLLSPVEHRPLPWLDARVSATGPRGAVVGILVCTAGVAALYMAKEGLGVEAGWWALLVFVGAFVGARAAAIPGRSAEIRR
jgi:hypothetical protein